MEIIPAIDILDGKCVQLVGGRLGTEKVYGDPVAIARKWESQGAGLLHVVDLDATLGRGSNMQLVLKIKQSVKVPLQFGGGIRTVEKARELLEKKIDRIIVGTMAVEDYLNKTGMLNRIAGEFGSDRLIAAVDSKKGMIVCKGWKEKTALKTTVLVEALEESCWGFLYTNVDLEGQMEGVDLGAVSEVVNATKKPVIISGGVSSPKDISAIEKTGAWGVVLGKALYEGRVALKDKV
jgi:phosphoribosylformimino-5-aminoimidazole carboxamide ribotide isomerase